jgi:hypothetical protein
MIELVGGGRCAAPGRFVKSPLTAYTTLVTLH